MCTLPQGDRRQGERCAWSTRRSSDASRRKWSCFPGESWCRRNAGGRVVCVCFFFQAEDGIRDVAVTGVQTCALPILVDSLLRQARDEFDSVFAASEGMVITLGAPGEAVQAHMPGTRAALRREVQFQAKEIGRASCRERGEISVVAVSLKKKKTRSR